MNKALKTESKVSGHGPSSFFVKTDFAISRPIAQTVHFYKW